jgi:hypothetical protein
MPCRNTEITVALDGTSTSTTVPLDWEEIRYWRDYALVSSDIFTNSDRWEDLTDTQKTELKTFRRTLRDIPQTYSNAEDVIFPVKPSWLAIDVNEAIFTGE